MSTHVGYMQGAHPLIQEACGLVLSVISRVKSRVYRIAEDVMGLI